MSAISASATLVPRTMAKPRSSRQGLLQPLRAHWPTVRLIGREGLSLLLLVLVQVGLVVGLALALGVH